MNNLIYNDGKAFHPGLINDLLLQSYEGIKGTTAEDKLSFLEFDRQVAEHPEWLGKSVFITTLDDRTIGFVSFDPRRKPQAEIGHNCVLPQYRNTGIGKQQIAYALEQIRKQGFSNAIVSTCENEDFIPAQKMYTACGFVEIHRFYKDDSHNDPKRKMIRYKIDF